MDIYEVSEGATEVKWSNKGSRLGQAWREAVGRQGNNLSKSIGSVRESH